MGSELRAKVISSIELNLVGFTDYALPTYSRRTVLPAFGLFQSDGRVSNTATDGDPVCLSLAASDGYASSDCHAGVVGVSDSAAYGYPVRIAFAITDGYASSDCYSGVG